MQRLLLILAMAALASAAIAQPEENIKPRESKFRLGIPLPALPAVVLDEDNNGIGIAQQTARSRGLQGRVLWVDATANLERVSSRERIENMVRRIKTAGFNTVVFDIKPIVGYTLYPSRLTEKLPFWRGQSMPVEFDPLKVFVEVTKREGLSLIVNLNAFSEGHRMAKEAEGANNPFFKPGPGYQRVDQQTMLYEPVGVVEMSWGGSNFPLSEVGGTLEADGSAIGVFNANNFPRQAPANAFGAVIDSTGMVLATVETGRWAFPGVPMGGSVLLGVGKAGSFLRTNTGVGRQLRYKTLPNFVPIQERPAQQIPLMMNPHDPRVRQRVLDFVKEVGTNYAVDGLVFDDRLRYGNLNADFSDVTRAKFETFVGAKLQWPQDVFEYTLNFDLTRGIRPGRWYETWLAWRAQEMRDWVIDAERKFKQARPGGLFGAYTGSWYGEYVRYGANWASPKLQAGFSFLDDNFRKTGFAPHLDLIMTGCYYRMSTIAEALNRNQPAGRTVEAAGQLTNRIVRDECWAYAGISLMEFRGNPRGLMNALQAAVGSTQGVMVFDYSHDIEQFWPVFERAFGQPAKAPHQIPGLLNEVRERRKAVDATGQRDPRVIIREGAAGTGL
jgi:uncharacterized lipoprotein YddW (UPF0748 family)